MLAFKQIIVLYSECGSESLQEFKAQGISAACIQPGKGRIIMEYTFTVANFEEEVLHSEIPVLVDFYADWCGPCKMMGPVVEKCAEAYAGKMKIGKLNVDENMAIAQKYRVVSIPHFIVFKNGEPAVTFGGAMSEADFRQKLDQVLA
mgnify:CR=1 FL=1